MGTPSHCLRALGWHHGGGSPCGSWKALEDTSQLPVKTTGLKEGETSLFQDRALNFHFALGPVNYVTSSA